MAKHFKETRPFFFTKNILTVLLPVLSAACQLRVCDAGQRCLATSYLSYGSYSHHSSLHASMTSSALLHLLIICLCVVFPMSVSLKPFCLEAFFPPLVVQHYLPLSGITFFSLCLFVFELIHPTLSVPIIVQADLSWWAPSKLAHALHIALFSCQFFSTKIIQL